ncbi:MAG: NAD+ synthase [Methanobacteriaceae archaeon]|nr:NAD+ synthase [Methanobacteriaceae archaeon]
MYKKLFIGDINESKASEDIIKFLKNKISKTKLDGFVLGLSGGIDSSTVAYLCAQSMPKDKILALILPSETTSSMDLNHAKIVAENLGIEYEIISIDELIEPFSTLCSHRSDKTAKANLKARIRMMILYYHANILNRLVVGTGNRTELLIGYFTKYGDGGVDILPIGDLYKTHVRQIASYIGIPQDIIEKSPTAGLWTGQTDEEELGMKYDLLDQLLYLLIDQGKDEKIVAKSLNIPLTEVIRIKEMVYNNKHKLFLPEMPLIR